MSDSKYTAPMVSPLATMGRERVSRPLQRVIRGRDGWRNKNRILIGASIPGGKTARLCVNAGALMPGLDCSAESVSVAVLVFLKSSAAKRIVAMMSARVRKILHHVLAKGC